MYKTFFVKYIFDIYIYSEKFSHIWRCHHYWGKATNFDLCSALMAIEQWGLLRVPHLLWHWTLSLHDQYWPKPSTRTSALVVMKFIIFVYPSMFNNAAVTWLKYCWYSVKTLSNQSMVNTPFTQFVWFIRQSWEEALIIDFVPYKCHIPNSIILMIGQMVIEKMLMDNALGLMDDKGCQPNRLMDDKGYQPIAINLLSHSL